MKLPPKKHGVSAQLLKLIAYDPLAGLHKPSKFKKRKAGGRAKFADGGAPDDTDEPVVVNKPFGELSAAPRPSPTQWLGNKAQDLMEYAGAKPDVARHLREGVGGVLGLTPLGIAGSAADAVDAKARGDTGGTAMAMAGMIPGVGPAERAVAREAGAVARAPKPAWMQNILDASEQRKKLAYDLAESGQPVRLAQENGSSALAGPDMSKAGTYRLTRFDETGPVGHTEHPTLQEAIDEGLRNKYNPVHSLEPSIAREASPVSAATPPIFVDTTVAPGIRAYHGSPHDFDRFSMDKIGTGEGAQAYGHGMYFAENEGVARGYRDKLSGTRWDLKNPTPEDEAMIEAIRQRTPMNTPDEAIADLNARARQRAAYAREDAADLINNPEKAASAEEHQRHAADLSDMANWIAEKRGDFSKGKMYEVNINADPAHFLDWDKPLPVDSPLRQKVMDAAREALTSDNPQIRNAAKDAFLSAQKPEMTGAGVHNSLSTLLGGKEPATQALNQAGIPGIKYLDQGSRTAGEGSRNYVVFNDKLIDIVKKYALAGIALPPAIAAQYEQMKQAGAVPPSFAAGGAVQHLADGGVPAFDETRGPDAVAPPPFDEAKGPDKAVSGLGATWEGAKQGATFGFSDELAGANAAGPEWAGHLPGGVGLVARPALGAARLAKQYFMGDDPGATAQYERTRDAARQEDEQAKAQHPYLHMAGEVAGSIPAMAILPEAGAVTKLGQGAGKLARLGAVATDSAMVGGEYGALSGLGEGKDLGDSALKSAEGIVGGIVGGAVAPVVGAGLSQVADRFVSPAVGAVRGFINPEAESARRLASVLQKDQDLISAGKAEGMTWQEWSAAKAAGEPVTLADLGSSNTQALLRSSANTSPEGRAVLEKVINDRFAGQTERVADTVRNLTSTLPESHAIINGKPYNLNPDGTVGTPITQTLANASKTAEELLAAYDKGRKPLYKQAYQQGDKEIVSPTIERLMGSPMFETAMKNAVTSGKDRAITEGYGAFNPGVTIENGMIKFTKTKPNGVPQYPNLQYWDSVKRELDGVASTAARAGDKGRAEVAGNMAKTLRAELDQQVPSYANARGVAAQYFGESNALEAGQKLAGKKVDPAQITQVMQKMKPDERDLFREGYASDWANRVIGNMSDSRDITKAMFNSPNERARALAVFGPAGLAKIQTRMTLETIMDGARKAMGNSTTARQLIEAGLAGGTLEGYLSGWDPSKMAAGAAGAAGARKFIGSEMAAGARKLVGKVDAKTARLVADLLTSDDPKKLAQGMRMAQKNQKIAAGLNNIANRVTLAGQSQGSAPLTRVYVTHAGLGQGPAPGYAGDENQKPPGPLH